MKKTLAALTAVTALAAVTACSSTTAPATAPAASTTSTSSASDAPSSTGPSATASGTTQAAGQGTPVTITAGDQTFEATFNDSQVSRDFLATLPRTLTWNRNAGIEYITELRCS